MKIRYAAKTDVGMKRTHNEDYFSLIEDEQLFLVADGMGGHASGEVASKMAAETIGEFYQRTKDEDATWPYKMDRQLSYIENRLVCGIKLANLRIFEAASKDCATRAWARRSSRPGGRRQGLRRPRRRLARLPRPRRQHPADDARPLAARGLQGSEAGHDRGGAAQLPAQERHHARARHARAPSRSTSAPTTSRTATSTSSAPTACRAWSRTPRCSRSCKSATTSRRRCRAGRRGQPQRRHRQHHGARAAVRGTSPRLAAGPRTSADCPGPLHRLSAAPPRPEETWAAFRPYPSGHGRCTRPARKSNRCAQRSWYTMPSATAPSKPHTNERRTMNRIARLAALSRRGTRLRRERFEHAPRGDGEHGPGAQRVGDRLHAAVGRRVRRSSPSSTRFPTVSPGRMIGIVAAEEEGRVPDHARRSHVHGRRRERRLHAGAPRAREGLLRAGDAAAWGSGRRASRSSRST